MEKYSQKLTGILLYSYTFWQIVWTDFWQVLWSVFRQEIRCTVLPGPRNTVCRSTGPEKLSRCPKTQQTSRYFKKVSKQKQHFLLEGLRELIRKHSWVIRIQNQIPGNFSKNGWQWLHVFLICVWRVWQLFHTVLYTSLSCFYLSGKNQRNKKWLQRKTLDKSRQNNKKHRQCFV